MNPPPAAFPCPDPVVVRCASGVVKGCLESPPWGSTGEALRGSEDPSHERFRIRSLDRRRVEEIPASEIKAIFFVSDLQGDGERNDLQFHGVEPALPGVWVQARFRDGEVIEGIVENSIRALLAPGFFLRPTDAGSNNRLIYIMKSALAEYHVLGVTPTR